MIPRHRARILACIAAVQLIACAHGSIAANSFDPKAVAARRSQIVNSVADVTAPSAQKNLETMTEARHQMAEFGKRAAMPGGARAIVDSMAPYRTAFPDIVLRPKRVLANAKIVLVQTVLSGTQRGPFGGVAPSQRSVSVEAFQLHWLRNGEIRRSVVYFAPEQLRTQVQGGDIARAAPAPAKYATYLRPEGKISKEVVASVYRMAALAVSSRMAWAAGNPGLASPFLGEVRLSNLDTALVTKIQPFSNALSDSKVSVENLLVSGPFVIAQVKFRGRHTATLGKYPPTNQVVELDVITVGQISGKTMTAAQSYIDQEALLSQLRKS